MHKAAYSSGDGKPLLYSWERLLRILGFLECGMSQRRITMKTIRTEKQVQMCNSAVQHRLAHLHCHRQEKETAWPLSFVVCFFLSSSSIPLTAFHPFSSDFLISGTCCSLCVEEMVFPELPLLCVSPLPDLPSAFLWWGLSVGLRVISH